MNFDGYYEELPTVKVKKETFGQYTPEVYHTFSFIIPNDQNCLYSKVYLTLNLLFDRLFDT